MAASSEHEKSSASQQQVAGQPNTSLPQVGPQEEQKYNLVPGGKENDLGEMELDFELAESEPHGYSHEPNVVGNAGDYEMDEPGVLAAATEPLGVLCLNKAAREARFQTEKKPPPKSVIAAAVKRKHLRRNAEAQQPGMEQQLRTVASATRQMFNI